MRLQLTFTDYGKPADTSHVGITRTYDDVRDIRKMVKSDAMTVTDGNGWKTHYRLSHIADIRLTVTH